MAKIEIDKDTFIRNSFQIQSLIEQHENFFFYFSPDPDAIGVSIAFALYLKRWNKLSVIYIPLGFDHNLEFLIEIALYNGIEIVSNCEILCDRLKAQEFVFVSCDTPISMLLPDYKKIFKIREKYKNKIAIELDHHFGGDSDQIYPESVTLFCKANSCCDILANFFQVIGEKNGNDKFDVEKYFPRNIVLSLLVGICYDTQFGKFLINNNNYEKWIGFLSERLKVLTWNNSVHMKTPSDVFHTINKMSKTKILTMSKLVDNGVYKEGIGLVILPLIGKYESLAENGDPSCSLAKISSDISNMIPEKAGKIGIFSYFDDFKRQYFIKIRRSSIYKDYDLREFENIIKEIFGESFLGGGGHPGATSFRLKNMRRETFEKRSRILFQSIIGEIQSVRSPCH